MSAERHALLLAGPQHWDERRPTTGKIRGYLEHLDPLGIAIVSSYLKQSGFETTYATLSPEPLPPSTKALIDIVNCVFISARYFDASMAEEAIKIAKEKGKTVVVGGYGPTFYEEKYAEADALVQGEFEPVAPELMDDLLSKRLKSVYDSRKQDPFNLNKYIYPDRSIFPKPPKVLPQLHRHAQEWQRGCSNYCSYCSPTRMQRGGGDTTRYRSVENIIGEIEQMGLKRGDHLFSVDLNTSSIPRPVLFELFTYLKEKGICWYTEGTIAPLLKDHDEYGPNSLLNLMSVKAGKGEGGCYSFLYGADDITSLKVKGSKDKEIGMLEKAVPIFKEMGIPLNLSVVIGLDDHIYPDTFYRYAYRLKALEVPYSFLHLATPYPSTPWGNMVEKEERIIDRDPLHYNHRSPVFKPKNMTTEELQQGYYWLMRKLYSLKEITHTFQENFDPTMAVKNPLLATIKSGLPWGVETYLSTKELEARGYINNDLQRFLDADYNSWLSQGNHG